MRSVFRKVSLERLASPEQLDAMLEVTNPNGWLVFIGLVGLLLIAGYWGINTNIPVQISAPTILLRSGGVKNLVATPGGQITRLAIDQGDIIAKGQLIAEIIPVGQTEAVPVYSLYHGRVLEVKADMGALVSPGQSLASLEFVGESISLEAVFYISASESTHLTVDLPVTITPLTGGNVSAMKLSGKIISISEYPVTKSGILRLLGSEDLAQSLVHVETPIEVLVRLDAPVHDARYDKIRSGTLATASVTIGYQQPIDRMIPVP